MEAEKFVEAITTYVVEALKNIEYGQLVVPVGISNRHVHLTKEHLENLFGKDYKLSVMKPLSQPGQFAANERVTLIGPKGTIEKVRILGPVRQHSQVEIARSDARQLGVNPPVSSSGSIAHTPGIIIKGPRGEVSLAEGVIVAERHLHMSEDEARMSGLSNGDYVKAYIEGSKAGIMEQVVVRVSPKYRLDLHIDIDDANAFALEQGQWIKIEKMV